MKKRSEWSFRLEQEHKYSNGAFFVTLTYDAKHLRTNGELSKRDLQLYLKRLRKKDGSGKIRYYAVGEYGTRSGRPHYHLLLFNSSEEYVRSSWQDVKGNAIGIVHIGAVTAASINYTLKYIVQPTWSVVPVAPQSEGQGKQTLQRPFATMSRAYGIGARYLTDEMVEWHRGLGESYCMRFDQKVKMPRFFATKIWYKEHEKNEISKKSMLKSVQLKIKEEKYLKEKYGDVWKEKLAEARLAVISRVKTKTEFSQKF